MITDQQVEEIILLRRLTGMSLANAVYAVVEDFDHYDFGMTAELSIRLSKTEKRLDAEFKEAHS